MIGNIELIIAFILLVIWIGILVGFLTYMTDFLITDTINEINKSKHKEK